MEIALLVDRERYDYNSSPEIVRPPMSVYLEIIEARRLTRCTKAWWNSRYQLLGSDGQVVDLDDSVYYPWLSQVLHSMLTQRTHRERAASTEKKEPTCKTIRQWIKTYLSSSKELSAIHSIRHEKPCYHFAGVYTVRQREEPLDVDLSEFNGINPGDEQYNTVAKRVKEAYSITSANSLGGSQTIAP